MFFVCLQICGQVNLYVRSSTEIEIQMNAVERVKHYSQVDTESYEGKTNMPELK